MTDYWTFERFLEFAEFHGWKLLKSCGQHRILIEVEEEKEKSKQDVERLFVIPVPYGRVDIEYVKRFKKLLGDKI